MAYYTGRNIFDDLLDDVFDAASYPTGRLMKTDIHEKDGYYVLEVELPGFDKQDVKVSLENGTLTVSAEHHAEENRGRLVRHERYEGTCSRSWYVGDQIRQSDIKASFKDGILTITLPTPQKKESEEKKVIDIL